MDEQEVWMWLDSLPCFDDDTASLQTILNELVHASHRYDHSALIDTAGIHEISATKHEPVPRKKRLRKTKSARQKMGGSARVKSELSSLRSSASELTKELELLQTRQRTRLLATEKSSQLPSCKLDIWKSAAQRQYRARRESEVANEMLRASLEEQRKLTQHMLRAINRGTAKPNVDSTSRRDDEVSPPRVAPHIESIIDHDASVDATKCGKLLRLLDTMTADVESVLEEVDFQVPIPCDVSKTRVQGGEVTVLDKRSVPFPWEAVSDTMWKCYADRATEPGEFPFKHTIDANLVVKGFRMALGSAFQLGSVEGVLVARRRMQHGRAVVAWAAEMAPTEAGVLSSRLSNVLSFATSGWNIVTEVGAAMTSIHMKHRVHVKQLSPEKAIVSGTLSLAMKKLVMQCMRHHQETLHRSVDDVFVDPHCSTGG